MSVYETYYVISDGQRRVRLGHTTTWMRKWIFRDRRGIEADIIRYAGLADSANHSPDPGMGVDSDQATIVS